MTKYRVSDVCEALTDKVKVLLFRRDLLVYEGIPSITKKSEFQNYIVEHVHINNNYKVFIIDIREDIKYERN